MAILIRNGKRLYPVGKFANIQHIFYNHNDRCYNAMIDSEYGSKEIDRFDESESFLEIVDNPQPDGMVYAEYKVYAKMKEIIVAYDIRHAQR